MRLVLDSSSQLAGKMARAALRSAGFMAGTLTTATPFQLTTVYSVGCARAALRSADRSIRQFMHALCGHEAYDVMADHADTFTVHVP